MTDDFDWWWRRGAGVAPLTPFDPIDAALVALLHRWGANLADVVGTSTSERAREERRIAVFLAIHSGAWREDIAARFGRSMRFVEDAYQWTLALRRAPGSRIVGDIRAMKVIAFELATDPTQRYAAHVLRYHPTIADDIPRVS